MKKRARLPIALLSIAALAACSDVVTDPPPAARMRPRITTASTTTAINSTLSPGIVYTAQYLFEMYRVNAINNSGFVVGDDGGNNIAKAWSPSTGYIVVGGIDGSTGCCSSLTDINAGGIASGWSTTTGTARAMTWNSASLVRTDLNIDPHRATGQAINSLGSVVGGYYDVFPYRAFYKAASGGYINIPVGNGATGSYAFDINASETIVGDAYYSGAWKATLWTTPTSSPQNLGTLGGSSSRAWQINDAGDVVGWASTAAGVKHAFLWTQSTGMIDLSTWPNSCSGDSEAFAINNNGVIAGRCDNKPVLWTAVEGMRELPLHAGSSGGDATDINDNNEVVGHTWDWAVTVWRISNRPPVADAGGPYSGVEGASISFSGAGSSDPDEDALAYSWNFGDPNSAGGGSAAGVSAAHTYADNGTYTVSLTVTDPAGAYHTSTSSVTVYNAAPVLGMLNGPVAPVPVGTSVAVSVSFTDAGTLDTHTGVIDWNANGTSISSLATVTSATGSGTLGGSYTYASPGVYTVRATVTDNGGDSDNTSYQYVVVYDPTAGFVTGGGWIESPAGAYVPNADLSGKATFGFVSRYEKGKTVPSGNTQFQFHAASMDFTSMSYDWLVIAGAKAQYKGAGTINGVSGYAFMLTATDGQVTGGGGVDRFRIKIWNTNSGEVIYDNQPGDPDDASASTALSGGSIVIHQK